MYTRHKSLIHTLVLVLGLSFLPLNVYAAGVYGINAGSDSEAVTSPSARYAICFDLPIAVNDVQSFSLGYRRNADLSNGSLSGLYGISQSAYIWSFGSLDTKTTNSTYINYSTSTKSFDFPAGRYCAPIEPNVGNNTFIGSNTDGGVGNDICTHSNPFPTSLSCTYSDFGTVNFTLCDSAGVCTIETVGAPGTSVLTHTPDDDATVSTSTSQTIGVTGYVTEEDFVEDMYVNLRFSPYSSFASSNQYAWQGLIFDVSFPITSSGAFDFTTTSNRFGLSGGWEIRGQIKRPHQFLFGYLPVSFGSWGDITVGDELNTKFIVGTSTYWDGVRDEINESIDTITSTSSTAALATCAPLNFSFNISDCLTVLFLGSDSGWQSVADSFDQNIMTKFPFGYLKRLYDIFAGDPTVVQFPHFSYSFGSSSPAVLQGSTIVLNPWTDLTIIDRIESDIDGSSMWDIFLPYWELLVGLGVLIHIVRRLTGVEWLESDSMSMDELDSLENPVPLDGYSEVGSKYRSMNDEFRSKMKKR
jgi:hypothetical protein